MKFSTDKTHRDYFYKHGAIEFDELFSPAQLKELNTAIDAVLCTKLSIKPFQLAKQMPGDFFAKGHDFLEAMKP
ncbi:MAG: hypothetical protein HWD61_08670 [Parachlamydiaceae bacterium]|nr:MAG: hypothetical protein HWD61_08670 [Parachlamydiaceae bacterium]